MPPHSAPPTALAHRLPPLMLPAPGGMATVMAMEQEAGEGTAADLVALTDFMATGVVEMAAAQVLGVDGDSRRVQMATIVSGHQAHALMGW